jgi:hypothetical protein
VLSLTTFLFLSFLTSHARTHALDDAYKHDQPGTFVFVLVFYWISIIIMTVLSSAIIIDGVRMQSEFETLQRRGLTDTGSETLQSILKRVARQLARCLCYRYGCWRSELCQTIIHSWCSYRKWLQWGRNNCCKGNSGKQSGADMPALEVLRRLSAWKAETANKDVLYLNFDHVLEAMRGDERSRRVVADHEVGAVLTLCYVDPKLKGESYFRTTREKDQYDAAERSCGAVLETVETEIERQERSLKQLFSGIRQLSADQTKNLQGFRTKMDDIKVIMRNNHTKLNSLRLRFERMNTSSNAGGV